MPTVTLKNIKSCEGHEGPVISLDIYIDGKKAGSMQNSGNGRCDSFYFINRELEEAFNREVKAWKGYKEGMFEADGAFITALLQEKENLKVKNKFARKGFPVTVIGRKNNSEFGWEHECFYGLKSEAGIPELISRYELEEVEVIK